MRKKKAASIFQSYKKMGYNLAGIGVDDLAAGCAFLKDLDPEGTILASANLYCGKRPAFSPFRIFKAKGLRIGVVSVSGKAVPRGIPGGNETEIQYSDPALERYMKKVSENSDLVIVLSSMIPPREVEFVKKHPGVALIISSGRTSPTRNPVRIGKTLVVSSHPRGKSVGIIRLFVRKNGDSGYVVNGSQNRLYLLEKRKH
ncbi:MAG: hypothetical protein DSZ23_04085 [Thermodesulfatator sp.]|nr:MAG: hypothetical protein DSZ23_04085 [Thermodesulfatator sp.]